MRIEMTNEVKEKLQPYVDAGKTLLLDLDNGLGPYSAEGNCALVTKFRFIAIDPDASKSDYEIALDSDLGPIYFKKIADDYIQSGMQLEINPKTKMIVFKNDRELVDGAVNIVDWDAVKANTVTMGGGC
ncbi:iron-sulfur cluster biosynthesis family protein [Companilactobacillus hulinensis]|uniref:iron-sulfur cluster biosynthesis family protein n=1 Tax=Companilactobacillus hulinensis TaxID=2486007 RepID=UPI000F77A384|nr:iron-sulfur cluster biosynthesis family protein [Companilactobacillus hulinensis]